MEARRTAKERRGRRRLGPEQVLVVVYDARRVRRVVVDGDDGDVTHFSGRYALDDVEGRAYGSDRGDTHHDVVIDQILKRLDLSSLDSDILRGDLADALYKCESGEGKIGKISVTTYAQHHHVEVTEVHTPPKNRKSSRQVKKRS